MRLDERLTKQARVANEIPQSAGGIGSRLVLLISQQCYQGSDARFQCRVQRGIMKACTEQDHACIRIWWQRPTVVSTPFYMPSISLTNMCPLSLGMVYQVDVIL